MAWTGFPILASDDLQKFSRLIQFWKAIRERNWALNNGHPVAFPDTAHLHYSGKITAITATSLTDSGAGWPIDWAHFTPTGGDDLRPTVYDVVIDGTIDYDAQNLSDVDEHRVVLQRQIDETDMPGKKLFFGSIADWVTTAAIPSLAWLVGKSYHVIKQGGTYWAERWPEYPNSNQLANGTFTTPTHASITDALRGVGDTDALVGKDLLVRGDDGPVHRVSITANHGRTIEFATQTWTPAGGAYAVVEPGAYGFPGAPPLKPFRWHTGLVRLFWSHEPEDGAGSGSPLRGAPLPELQISRLTGVLCDEPEDVVVWDFDAQIDWDDPCNSPRDHFYSPYLYRSLRQLQVWLEQHAPLFVEPKSYHGLNAIPPFATATWMKFATIGENYTRTITGFSGGITFATLSAFFIPDKVHYAIYDGENLLETGHASCTNTQLGGGAAGHVGKTVIIAFGWTRKYPREFRYMFPKTCFIPDIAQDLDELGDPLGDPYAADPPTSDYPGTWENQNASTTYAQRELHDFDATGRPGQVYDGPEVFVEEDAARFIGDNFADTTTEDPVTAVAPDRPGGMALLTPYFDHFYTGQGAFHPMSSTGGIATDGTVQYLADSAADWAPSVLIEHTGTPTSLSTTTIADTGQAANGIWTTAFRLVGQWIRIVQPDGGPLDGVSRPITAQNTATQTLTFPTIAGLTATYTDDFAATRNTGYAIREPAYEVNRWQGRTVELAEPDGTLHTAEIQYSDRRALWFTAPLSVPVAAGWSFRIHEPKTGEVFLRRSAKWIIPPVTEDDPRAVTPNKWPKDQTSILPQRVKRFGRLNAGDDITRELFNELYRGINALVYTLANFEWNNKGEDNSQDGTALLTPMLTYPSPPGLWTDFNAAYSEGVTRANANWDSLGPSPSATTAAPEADKVTGSAAYTFGVAGDAGRISGVTATRIYSYPRLTGLPTNLYTGIDWYAWSEKSSEATPADWPYKIVNVFEDEGLGLVWQRFASVGSLGAANTATRFGSRVGNPPATHPTFLAPEDAFSHATGPDTAGMTNFHGFKITNAKAVIKWNVTGGLSYV